MSDGKYKLQEDLQDQYNAWMEADQKIFMLNDTTHPLTDEWVVDWMLKVELDAKTEIEAIKSNAEARVRQIENRVKAAHFKYGDTFRIEAKERLERELKGKKKSIRTEYGKIGYRTKPATLVVEDPKELYDYVNATLGADVAKDAVHVDAKELVKLCSVETVRKAVTDMKISAVKKQFLSDGVEPDGCMVIEAEDQFFYKAGK